MGIDLYDEFQEELEEIDKLVHQLAMYSTMTKDEEGNDPEEDEKLTALMAISTDLQYAAEALNDAVTAEYRRRDDLYEEDTEEEKHPYDPN